jgi:hypothetical protein
MMNVFQTLMTRSPSDLDYTRMIVKFAKVHVHNRRLFLFSETLESFS